MRGEGACGWDSVAKTRRVGARVIGSRVSGVLFQAVATFKQGGHYGNKINHVNFGRIKFHSRTVSFVGGALELSAQYLQMQNPLCSPFRFVDVLGTLKELKYGEN